jgi:dihydrofolate reductase
MLQFDKNLKTQLSNVTSKAEFLAIAKHNLQRKPRFGFNTHGNVIPIPNPGGKNVTIIAAMDAKRGIGKNNGIPWAISPDMQQFKRLTMSHPVVMGRKTWESMGSKPLPGRLNIVVTRDIGKFYTELENRYHECTVAMPSLDLALAGIEDEQVFIIGGAEIYKQALELNLAHDMILTHFKHDAQCDTFFPELQERFWMGKSYSTHELSGGIYMRYEYWRRITLETPPLKE